MRIDGFPTSIGNKRAGCITVMGPVGYAAGGFEVEARALGLKEIDWAGVTNSDDGTVFATVRIISADGDASPRRSVFVQAFVFSTGVEVADAVNLSGLTFRVFAIGI